ncbi:hypothetical protein [Methylomicrobium lacus]|uniref:hypothetical protein n=1 Tax=Methylomicrobium lacus TaxID=136992 RepID=UPI0035A8CB51
MNFDYQKTLEKKSSIATNVIVIAFVVIVGGILGISKQYVYFISGFIALVSPFVFYFIDRIKPLDIIYEGIKSYKDRRLFNKSEQQFNSLVLNKYHNKIIKQLFSFDYEKFNESSASKFWEANISQIESDLKIKPLEEMKIGGHIAVPAQGSVILHKAKSAHKYLTD